jgi:MarR family transcriptional regulator, 2-MHQ and catechol-resistance regulon repressor
MPEKKFLPALREITRTYQAFSSYSAAHVRTLGLTPSQFDIIATLGNTSGISYKELGEKTLITKGTLTGVINRLELKKIISRTLSPSDARSQIIQLTRTGETLFSYAFPAHIKHLERIFTNFSQSNLDKLTQDLQKLQHAVIAARIN